MRGKNRWIKPILLLAMAIALSWLPAVGQADTNQPRLPVEGMVNLIDVGAGTCIPCKMMAPILEELKKEYQGRAVIHFVDIRHDRSAIEKFALRGIPTQIFFDRQGKEVYRHLGYMEKAEIVKTLQKLGVK